MLPETAAPDSCGAGTRAATFPDTARPRGSQLASALNRAICENFFDELIAVQPLWAYDHAFLSELLEASSHDSRRSHHVLHLEAGRITCFSARQARLSGDRCRRRLADL